MAKYKSIFISEAEDQLEKLNKYLLEVEKAVNDGNSTDDMQEVFNELMRASHTIKGSSSSMGYIKMAFLAHVMEDIFDFARHGKLELDTETVNHAFEAIDNLEKSLEVIKKGGEEIDFDDFANKLKTITGVTTTGTGKSMENKEDDKQIILQNKETLVEENKKNLVEQKLSKKSEEEVHVAKIDYIKVPVARLDSLMDMVEELLIDKMRLEELSQTNAQLKEISGHINLLVSGIQYEVMQARLVPIEQVFTRFPRMVRDLAKKQNKKIVFEVKGGDIELDRTVVDKLGEPLVHLLRNAIDHGIEKDGTIKLEAMRESESVIFVVENTGVGMDLVKIKESAVKRGIVNPKEIETYNDKALIDLIFHPNFSTNKTVTEVSGRGVGLSVVKKFVEAFGGRVLVENSKSKVRFVMELPQTLAIIEALLINVEDMVFAIPFANIERSVIVRSADVKRMADHDMTVVDGINVPLINLAEEFKSKKEFADIRKALNPKANVGSLLQKENKKKSNKINDRVAVLIKRDNELVGIVVNGLVGEQEVIVKPFTSILQNLKGFSGSTILGDGRVVLIIDVASFLKNIKK